MVIIKSSACKQCTVGVESRTRNRSRSGVMEEARIRLEGREVSAVNVESFDFMAVRTTLMG